MPNKTKKLTREKIIINTSVIGIIANFLLAGFKAVVGILSVSIAIVLDAVNNLSDALSSTVTIIGTKLAGKAPDKDHPYGHGRAEYLSAMIVAIIILYAGLTSAIESIKKIFTPIVPDYSTISIVIVSVAIVVKILLGIYVSKKGKQVNSEVLENSGKDALMDSLISTATLVSAIIFLSCGLSLEAYLGTIIAILILKTGIDMLKSSLSQILGERVEKDFALSLKNTVTSFKDVRGAYDLILNNYGPDTYLGSIHIEVEDTMTAVEIDALTRKIMKKVYDKHGVILTAVGIYSYNTEDEESVSIRDKVSQIVHSYSSVMQMHGFYHNKADMTIQLDIILDFGDKAKEQTYASIYNDIQRAFPDYKIQITLDYDVSD